MPKKMESVQSNFIVLDYINKDDYIRAVVAHILDVQGLKMIKSEYTIWYHKETKTHYCTCIGNLVGKRKCAHLKAFFDDGRIKKIIGEK